MCALQVVGTLANVEVGEVDVEIQPHPEQDLVAHPWVGETGVMGTTAVPQCLTTMSTSQ